MEQSERRKSNLYQYISGSRISQELTDVKEFILQNMGKFNPISLVSKMSQVRLQSKR